MGKRPQRRGSPEAKKLCRLNLLDIEMAKRLGFERDALIRAIPSPKQKWTLPVEYWERNEDSSADTHPSAQRRNLKQSHKTPF